RLACEQVGPATALASGGQPVDGPALLGLSLPRVSYGRVSTLGGLGAAGPAHLKYTAANCIVASSHTLITCNTVEGTGRDLVWAVEIGNQVSVVSNGTSSYAPPAIAWYTGPGAQSAVTQGGDEVLISGQNFGPVGTPIEAAEYGRNGSTFVATDCAVVTAHVAVRCRTAVGAGSDLTWSLQVDSQRSVAPSTAYRPPVIVSIQGDGARDASTEGGQRVMLNGTDFSTPMWLGRITYGVNGDDVEARDCRIVEYHRSVECTLAPGTGRLLRWLMSVGGQTSALSSVATSYAAPRIDTVSPSIVSTDGTTLVSLRGSGFGAAVRTVAVRVYVSTGYEAVTKPPAADVAAYWNALLAGAPPPASVAGTVSQWLASLAQVDMGYGNAALSTNAVSVRVPAGYGTAREMFVFVDGVPSNVVVFNYDAPRITNIAPDRRDVPASMLRLWIDGANFCRDTVCGRLLVNDEPVPVQAGNWSHAHIMAYIPTPEVAGSVQRAVVEVDGRASEPFVFSNPVPSFPSSLNSLSTLTRMSTAGGQLLSIEGVTEITNIHESQITIYVGPFACTNTTKLFLRGASLTDPAAEWMLTALTPAGVGANLYITIAVPGGRSRESDTFLFSYAPPSLTGVHGMVGRSSSDGSAAARRLQPSAAGGVQVVPSVGGVLRVLGQNLGSPEVGNATLTVLGGAMSSLPYIVRQTHTELDVYIPPGEGAGLALSVYVGGNTSNAMLFSYLPPNITLLVSGDAGPTTGGTNVTLQGGEWGITSMPAVHIGGAPCALVPGVYAPVLNATMRTLTCVLPVGVGASLPITITVGGQTSAVLADTPRYSYARPSVDSVTPAGGPTSGRQPPAQVENVATGAITYTPGERLIMSITGANFGISVPAVIRMQPDAMLGGDMEAGATITVNASDIILQTHSLIRLYMPEGYGSGLAVHVTIAGQASAELVRFDYDPPSIAQVRRSDRPPVACQPVQRCFDVALPSGELGNATLVTRTICRSVPAGCYPTRAGYPLEVLGASFGGGVAPVTVGGVSWARIMVGDKECPLVSGPGMATHDRLVCIAPDGMGDALSVRVRVGGRWSSASPNATFAYDPPEVVSVSSSTPDAVGAFLTIRGRNFGTTASDAVVYVGGQTCADATWLNDGTLTCSMPPTLVGPKNVSVLIANRTSAYVAADYEMLVVAECKRGLYGLVGETCVDCEAEAVGGVCPGGELYFDLVVSQPGFWRFNFTTPHPECHPLRQSRAACPVLYACEPKGSCLGNNVCAEGYTADRCAQCLPGKYYRVNGECIKCPNAPYLILAGFAAAAIVATIAGYMLNKYNVSLTLISIGLDFFQVVSMFVRTRVRWPPVVKQLLTLMSAFNLNLEIAAPECMIPDVNFAAKWAFVEVLPIVVFLALTLVYVLNYLWKRAFRNAKKANVHGALPTFIAIQITILRVLYLYLTRTTLDVFNCTPTDPPDPAGNTYMAGLLDAPCGVPGGLQMTLLGPAIVALGLYVLCLPTAAFLFLRSRRQAVKVDQLLRARGTGFDLLSNPHYYQFRRTWSRLYQHYKPGKWYWEVVILARKFLIAFTSLMFRNSASYQLAVGLLVMFLAFVLHVRHAPYLTHAAKADVVEDVQRRALTERKYQLIDAEVRAALKNGEKNGRRRKVGFGAVVSELKAQRAQRAESLATAGLLYIFDYNTVETVLLSSSVLLLLAGIMFDSSRFSSAFSSYYVAEYDSLTYATMVLLVASITYFFVVFIMDIIV
ncbi:hypothetical protein EON62_00085, partial [archaeon]